MAAQQPDARLVAQGGDACPECGASTRRSIDVGCGTGEFLAFLAARDPALRREGIELDLERAARARDPGARIHTGDAQATLSQVAGPFDPIALRDVFEHVPAPSELLPELVGRLGYRLSGGFLRGPARRTHEAHRAVFFTRASLERAARGAGLRISELWWGRLSRGRMDGAGWLTALTSLALRAENALGGGLFVNLPLERSDGRA
ncbi:MAG TPA: methyltransferase domain-containing protein [Myxococcota bacterium]|nr:methyltransferase domain-containing protein [Myxococcota bacterium]